MKCYICVSVPESDECSYVYENLLEACLNSAEKNTSFELIALYDGPETHTFYSILCSHNVNVIKHRFSHFSALRQVYTKEYIKKKFNKDYIDYKKLAGTFMRFDIPSIETQDDYVLYCDFDIIFLTDIKEGDLTYPKFLLAGPESVIDDKSYFNAGILYLNINSMKNICSKIFQKLEKGIPNSTGLFDQGYLNEECLDCYEPLPVEFNWKPYWGFNPKAKIIHFHGLKPRASLEDSGFNTTKDFYSSVFKSFAILPGYILNLKKFFLYLGGNADEWINDHLLYITSILYKEADSCRRKANTYYFKQILTLGLIKRYREKYLYFKKRYLNYFK